jgi:hypothetical protein
MRQKTVARHGKKLRCWLGTEGFHGGEVPEHLGGEVFSMRQETVARHGKKLRRWLGTEPDRWLSRRGSPRAAWRRGVLYEAGDCSKTWQEVKAMAKNRVL